MSSEQAVKLAATIEVLTGAIGFLIAERVAAQPDAVRGELLHILQGALSKPSGPAASDGVAAATGAALARWTPIVAAGLIDEVRHQLGRPAAGAGPGSKVAEGPSREHARDAVAHFEHRRAVA